MSKIFNKSSGIVAVGLSVSCALVGIVAAPASATVAGPDQGGHPTVNVPWGGDFSFKKILRTAHDYRTPTYRMCLYSKATTTSPKKSYDALLLEDISGSGDPTIGQIARFTANGKTENYCWDVPDKGAGGNYYLNIVGDAREKYTTKGHIYLTDGK